MEGPVDLLPPSVGCWCGATYSCCAEFAKILAQTALGFVVLGFVGFFVKLMFIVRFYSRLMPFPCPSRSASTNVSSLFVAHQSNHYRSVTAAQESVSMVTQG